MKTIESILLTYPYEVIDGKAVLKFEDAVKAFKEYNLKASISFNESIIANEWAKSQTGFIHDKIDGFVEGVKAFKNYIAK